MEYWTIKDDRHAGPFTAGQLADMGITPDTPVWHEGLPDWVPAREIAEIAAIMVARQNGGGGDGAPAPAAQAAPPAPGYAPQQPVYASHEPLSMARPVETASDDECPPAPLAWGVVSLILCCMPLGVLAIIFAAQVKPAWRRGDVAKARRASERAQWCVILSMSVGLIAQIFSGVFQAAAGL